MRIGGQWNCTALKFLVLMSAFGAKADIRSNPYVGNWKISSTDTARASASRKARIVEGIKTPFSTVLIVLRLTRVCLANSACVSFAFFRSRLRWFLALYDQAFFISRQAKIKYGIAIPTPKRIWLTSRDEISKC